MELITIRTFDNYFSASIVLTRLRDSGIECFLKDEFTVTIDPLLSNAIGGIKLVVKDADVKDALAMLEEIDAAYRAAATCPKCGSTGLEYISKPGASNTITALLTWTFFRYAIAPDMIYHCESCGWEGKQLPDNHEPLEEVEK